MPVAGVLRKGFPEKAGQKQAYPRVYCNGLDFNSKNRGSYMVQVFSNVSVSLIVTYFYDRNRMISIVSLAQKQLPQEI